MNTRIDALTVLPRPAKAANEEFLPVLSTKATGGWDAYEVWRTRIKAEQRNSTSRGVPAEPAASSGKVRHVSFHTLRV
jgi:hypothetical protein